MDTIDETPSRRHSSSFLLYRQLISRHRREGTMTNRSICNKDKLSIDSARYRKKERTKGRWREEKSKTRFGSSILSRVLPDTQPWLGFKKKNTFY